MTSYVVMDNEAINAANSSSHAQHRQVLAAVQIVASRKRKGLEVDIVVPTAVRAEANWDRTNQRWAFVNRLTIRDVALDRRDCDVAASIRSNLGPKISVADAHIGATFRRLAGSPITVLSSDPDDMRAVAGGVPITIIAL